MSSFAQDYYSGKTEITCDNLTYNVIDFTKYGNIYIENATNHMRDQLRYKVGSNPVKYYSYAHGMGHFADFDEALLRDIVRVIFTDEEIAKFTACPGIVELKCVVDPDSRRVLEVEYVLLFKEDPAKTVLSIPVEKLAALEVALKDRMIMVFSDKLIEERQSYVLALHSDLFSIFK